jgi:hypothetical protein
MAQERATLTFTLEDDFSAKMAEITGKLEDFKRSLSDTSDRSEDSFEQGGKALVQLNQRIAATDTRLQSMANMMRNAFSEFTKSLAHTQRELGNFEQALVKLSGTGSQIAGRMRGVGGAIASVGAAVAAAVGGLAVLGRAFASSYQQAQNLRTRLGETNDYFILLQQRIGRHLGQTRNQTTQQLEHWKSEYYDSVRGSASDLFSVLTRFGDEGIKVWNQIDKARASGMGAAEAYSKILMPWLSTRPEDQQRRLSTLLEIPISLIRQYREEAEKIKPPWIPDDETWERWKQANVKLKTVLDAMNDTLDDAGRKYWFKFKLQVVNILGDIVTWINTNTPAMFTTLNTKLDEFKESDFMKEVMDEIRKFNEQIVKLPKEFEEWGKMIHEVLEPIFQFLEKWGLVQRQLPKPKEGEAEGQAPKKEGQTLWEWMQPTPEQEQARSEGRIWTRPKWMPKWILPRLQLESGGAGGGGEAIYLKRQASDEQQKTTDMLREVRDVMVWLRTQMEDKAGVGGPFGTTQRTAAPPQGPAGALTNPGPHEVQQAAHGIAPAEPEPVGPVAGKGWGIETQRKLRRQWNYSVEGTGKASWYGTFGAFRDVDPKTGKWQDKPGSASLGQMWGMKYFPEEKQGIALPNAATLGRLFRLTSPQGEQFIEQHTDIGPARKLHRQVDISAAALTRMGKTPETFKTDEGEWKIEALPSFGQEARMQRGAAAASVGRPGAAERMALTGEVPETTPTTRLRPSIRSYQSAQRALRERAGESAPWTPLAMDPRVDVDINVNAPQSTRVESSGDGIVNQPTVRVDSPTRPAEEMDEE